MGIKRYIYVQSIKVIMKNMDFMTLLMDIILGEKHQGYISVIYNKIVRIMMLDRKLI